MSWKQFFTSSIGKKFIMALTGISLILFLIVHVGINATVFANDNGVIFNKVAAFMGGTLVPRILEIGLFIGILLHIIQGFVLVAENNKRRGIGYAKDYGNRGSKWYSRSMGLLGTIIFLFLIMHIAHFWVPSRITGLEPVFIDMATGTVVGAAGSNVRELHNLYAEMLHVFQGNLLVVILYVLGCIALAYHLMHGFQSAFRTFGVRNQKYLSMLTCFGIGFSIVVCAAFAIMPVAMYLGWVN